MFTTSFLSLRRLSGCVLPLLLSSACFCAEVAGQSPLAVSGNAAAVPHNESYGAPWQSAVSNRGDFVLFDFKTTGMYEYPANGGAEITLAAPGAIAGGFTDSGIAIDPRNNNIYLNNNYNGGLLEYPFDPATGTWDLPSVVVANGLSGNLGGVCGNYYQAAGLSINHSGILAVGTENGCGVEIFTVPIDASGNFGAATAIVSNMKQRAKTVAIDDAGNIYYNADAGGFAGAAYIPAGTTGLADESTIARIDPSLGNVQGVTLDAAGNVFVVDGSAGAYLIPLVAGVPSTAAAILLSSVPANGGPSFDQTRGVLFYPTSGSGSIKDLVDVYINRAEFGTVPLPAAAAVAGSVNFNFDGDVTPYTFTVAQDGISSSGFTVSRSALAACGITFTMDSMGNPVEVATTYHAGSSCTLPVSFTPTTVGDASAILLMQDQSGNVLSSIVLHGVGQGSAAIVSPGLESAIGAGLVKPSQIAVDASGNIYVADSGKGKVLTYAKGSTAASAPTSVGTGLTAPTGVAVDGAGNVYIADSGSVFVVPYGAGGLNASGQTTLKSGLGTNLKLAVDAVGDLYIADPDNQQVERLRNLVSGLNETDITGFTQLSAIAADGAGDFFVADGPNLIEVSASYQKTLVSSLSGTNGLAVDASGAVYVSQTAGTVRIPNEGGALTPADQTAIGLSATAPTSVAVDALGNAYVADGAAKDVDMVSASGLLNFGTLATTTSTQMATAMVISSGNVSLNVTGFSSTLDYTETATTCVGAAIAIGSSCTATITFNPGPGDQGTLTGALAVQGDAANSPVVIDVTGVGASLAVSTTTLTVTNPTVTNAPVTVVVASKSGTGPAPTGNVQLVLTATGMKTITFTGPLVNGTVSFSAQDIQAGTYTFTANYIGDRVYGTSSASQSVTIASGTVILVQPDPSTVPTYVLAAGTGSQEPYDNSQAPYYYNYPVVVKSADGNPLIGVPIYNGQGTLLGTDYGTVTYLLSGGTPACNGVPVNADGTAPLGTQCFTINTSNNQIPNLETTYTVTPVYTGNSASDYATSMGTPVTFIALRNPSVVITSNPASLSLPSGSTASATLTLTSLLGYGVAGAGSTLNNYSLPLELECDNLPAHASCTFTYPTPDASDPNSVDVNVGAPGTVMMTINTNVAVGTTSASIARSPVIFAAMFGAGLLSLAFGRKRVLGISLMKAVGVVFLTGAALGMVACSSANISVTPMLTTPAGTYNVTVTAKQAGSKTVLNSQGVPVAVQGNGNQMSIPFAVNVTVQ